MRYHVVVSRFPRHTLAEGTMYKVPSVGEIVAVQTEPDLFVWLGQVESVTRPVMHSPEYFTVTVKTTFYSKLRITFRKATT